METHEGRRNSVVRGVKGFQIDGSWVPMTPLNPSLTRPRPIYEQGRGGEADLVSHTLFLREYDDPISRFSHHQNQSQIENNNHTHYWENVLHNNNNYNNPLVGRPIFERENVGMQTNWSSQGRRLVPEIGNANLGQSNFPIYDSWEFSNSNDNGVRGNGSVVGNNCDESLSQFNSMSFGDLLAMNGSVADHPTNFSMPLGNSCGSTTNDFFRGGLAMNSMRLGSSSGAMATNDFFQGGLDCSSTFRGVNLQIDGFAPGEMQSSAFQYQNGSLCNVNSSPRTNHTNGNMFSFAPPTPDLQQRADNVLTARITNEQNNMEVMVGARDSSLDKGSIVIEENHNPDKVGEQGIDLNKTPAQKKTRRRRYTPKVVREGKPKRTPKSSTPKPPKDLSETPKVKRKYVWKNNKSNPPLTTPPPGETTEDIDPKSTEPPIKASCKRSLNFDLNEQEIEGSYANPNPKESMVETSEVGVACDLNRTLFQEPTNYGPNSSPCASSNQGVQMRGSKRVRYSSITDVIEGKFGNVVPTSLGNVNIDGVPENLNPEIREKKRTEDPSQASSSIDHQRADLGASKYYYCNPVPFEGNASALNQAAILLRNAQNREQLLNTWADISRLKKKKHSVGKTRVCDFTPIAPAIPPEKGARMTGMNPPNGVNSCVEALTDEAPTTPPSKRGSKKNISSRANRQLDLVLYDGNRPAMKKKGRRYSKNKVSLRWISTISLEAITEGLKQLDINRKDSKKTRRDQNAIVPYQMNNQEKNALVLYKKDGTMVPYEGPFEPIRKRRQRAKVELDDETTRVWRLLLENIDNQGIDGTDEDKVKWWDNERCVFSGRVDSFIARMRLVQGDRRFTPWKGSVLDSVIGVFLTQNVSDHLSSSAFMTMVARYPLKLERDESTLSEEATSALVVEPEVYIVEPEESITWNEKALDHSEEKEVDYYGESSQKPTNNESRVNKANSPTTDTEGGSIVGYDKARDDTTSSQQSVISSQNSVSSANFQATGGIVGSVSETNCNFFDGPSPTSFMGLLKMAESPLLHESCSRFPGNFGKDFPEASSDYQYFHLQASKYMEMPEAESRSSDMSRKDENSPTKESNLTESVVQDLGNEKYLNDVPRSFVLDGEQRIVHSKTQGQTSSIWKSTTNLPNSAKEANVTESFAAEIKQILKQSDANPSPRKPSSNSRPGKAKKEAFDWDSLRREARDNGRIKERTANTRDSIDWERVRRTHVSEIADTIKARGMNNMLSERIKELLDRLVRDHGSIDLEWIRYIPPDKAKEYLLSFRGLGLKSVECVRLLTLHHLAFPVDTNVGRIAVRLGWVPLQPLPESLQLHLLEMYPILESIQKYLWPRLCKLDQKTLYELHYHMITFGKVFCTKRQPNCNACPLRGECRHFASAFASARLALPGPEERSIVASNGDTSSNINFQTNFNPLALPAFWGNQHSGENPRCDTGRSIVEVRSTPLSLPFPQTIQHLERKSFFDHCEPIVEVPASPEPEPEPTFCDIEDAFYEDPNEIPTIELNMKEFTHTLENFMQANRELTEAGISKAMVALTAEAASIPTPKLKNINRLRTEHHVYELPDTHPLLKEMDKREHDDPCSYLLAIWTPGETAESIDPPERRCNFEDPNILCNEVTCAYCSSQLEANSQIVRGTLLIPCRTAMRGSFPLNGTYFQVNEVFADHDSSLSPIEVPRTWLWNLPRRTVYFGTSIPSIFKGLNTEEIQHCFWRGYVCVRGFDQKTRAPRPLMARLHFPASRMAKGNNGKPYRDDE